MFEVYIQRPRNVTSICQEVVMGRERYDMIGPKVCHNSLLEADDLFTRSMQINTSIRNKIK
jgi:hypothetical protein